MKKKNVLGSDPLKWLKEDNKKENTESSKSDHAGQEKQAKKPPPSVNVNNKEADVKRREKQEEKAYEPINVSETLKLQENKLHGPGNVSESNSLQEEKAFNSSVTIEANRKAVLGKDACGYHAKSRKTTQKESPATAFVIVYTVLLLILGFIIYRDMTKQIERLETKLEIVEKQLEAGLINYEDTELDDVW